MKRKRILLFTIVLALLIGVMPANATEIETNDPEPVIEEYIYLYQITSTLSINSSGLATCSGSATISDLNNNYYVTVSVSLQRQDSSSWTTLNTWYNSSFGTAARTEQRYVTHGHYYKVVTTATVYNSAGTRLESAKLTSQVVYY